MLDVNSLSLRLKTLMKSILDGSKSETNYSLIMEPDFEHEGPNNTSKLEENDPHMNNYDSAHSYSNGAITTGSSNTGAAAAAAPDGLQLLDLCQAQRAHVEAGMREACERELGSCVVFPAGILARVAEDILRMSVAEPCGARGCAILLWLREKDGAPQKLATVFGSSVTPPTFEIHVTLMEDTRGWRTFQKVFLTIKGCLLNKSQWKTSPRILHSAYQLEKRRLYRSPCPSLENSGYH